MLRQIKYHPNHISKMQANCMHGDDWFNKYDILEISKFGGVRTVIDENDDIVAIIGVQVKEDVGIVWVSPSSIVSKHGLSFARLIKQHIERIEDVLQLEKIQTMCYKVEERVRFLEWLGFEYIGQNDLFPEFAVFERVK